MELTKFSSIKKYYHSYEVSTGEEGWYNFSNSFAVGGSRLLRSTSPPPKAKRKNENYISSSGKKRIRVDEETNAKNDESFSGKQRDEETNAKNDESFSGKQRDEETNAKNDESFSGKKRDEETNAKNDENRLIRELTTDTIFLTLYLKIIHARRNNNSHAVLENYYFLGVELERRLESYKKVLKEHEAQKKVSNEVRGQIPKVITDDDIRKNTLIARKINNFFVRLSDDNDQRMAYVQRIKTFTADYISSLSSDNVKYVISRVRKDFKRT